MAIGKTFIMIMGENEPFPNTASKHPTIFLKKVNPYLGKPTAILGFSDGYGNVFSSILTAEQGTIAGDIADLNIRNPSDGQVLTYSAASNTWVNQTSAGGSVSAATSFSATSLSGGTIFSGSTDLSVTFGTKMDKDISINSQSGTTYTLALADKARLLEMATASGVVLTIPANATVAFPIGSQVLAYQAAAGQITFSASSGVVMISSGGKNKTSSSGSTASLIKVATNNWLLSGDITT